MVSLGALLVGPGERDFRRLLYAVLAVALFAVLFAAYVKGLFALPGDRPFLRGDVAVVGALGAAWIGLRRGGLAFAWLVAFGALLGGRAGHVFVERGGSRPAQLAQFLDSAALASLAAEGVVLGTLAFLVGAFLGRVLRRLRDATARTDPP